MQYLAKLEGPLLLNFDKIVPFLAIKITYCFKKAACFLTFWNSVSPRAFNNLDA